MYDNKIALYIHADKDISYINNFKNIYNYKCTTINSSKDTKFIKDLIHIYSLAGFNYDMTDYNKNIIYFWNNTIYIDYYLNFDIFNYKKNNLTSNIIYSINTIIYTPLLSDIEQKEIINFLYSSQKIEYVEYFIYSMHSRKWPIEYTTLMDYYNLHHIDSELNYFL